MKHYPSFSKSDVVAILSPDAGNAEQERSYDKKTRTPRKQRRYLNPHTNESVVVSSLANATTKEWIQEYGKEVVKGWEVQA